MYFLGSVFRCNPWKSSSFSVNMQKYYYFAFGTCLSHRHPYSDDIFNMPLSLAHQKSSTNFRALSFHRNGIGARERCIAFHRKIHSKYFPLACLAFFRLCRYHVSCRKLVSNSNCVELNMIEDYLDSINQT